MKWFLCILLAISLSMGILACAFAESEAEVALKEGMGYWWGYGPNGYDMKKAQEAFQRAADLGNADAWYWLGEIAEVSIEQGHFTQAAEYYQKAADLGSGLGLYGVGRAYGNGWFGEKDLEKCKEYYQQAADASCGIGYIGLGRLAQNGRLSEEENAKAVEYYKKAESSDDWYSRNVARLRIGQLYWYGLAGIDKDYDKALEWFRKAADEGYSEVYEGIAYIYLFTDDYEGKDSAQGIEWYEKAAACGRPYNLAICYRNGTGVKKDYKKVVELCMICAEGGRGADGPLALLALCYCNGEGVKKNKKTAREYCMKTFTMMGVEESEIDSIETSGVGVGLAKWILDYIGK